MELQPIQSKIYEIRGQRVMLDFDPGRTLPSGDKAAERGRKAQYRAFRGRRFYVCTLGKRI